MVLVLFTSPDSVLYLYQALSKYLIGLNTRVNARVVANLDGRTDRRTFERTENLIPISRHA